MPMSPQTATRKHSTSCCRHDRRPPRELPHGRRARGQPSGDVRRSDRGRHRRKLADLRHRAIQRRPIAACCAGRTFELVDIEDNWDGTFLTRWAEIRPQTWALDPDKFTPVTPVTPVDISYLWNPAAGHEFRGRRHHAADASRRHGGHRRFLSRGIRIAGRRQHAGGAYRTAVSPGWRRLDWHRQRARRLHGFDRDGRARRRRGLPVSGALRERRRRGLGVD
jgi:hypothetical protein